MPYVIVYKFGELKYFVQKYRDGYRLNGLLDNALVFPDEFAAAQAIPRLEDTLGKKLRFMEIPGPAHQPIEL